MKPLALALFLSLAGCAAGKDPCPATLPQLLMPMQDLPTVAAKEFVPSGEGHYLISFDVYRRLAERDRLLRKRARDCDAVAGLPDE